MGNAISQISVFMENRPGQMSEILKTLSGASINLRALNIAETSDYGVLRLIVDDTGKAEKVLADNGIISSRNDVFAVCVPDRPGGLSELLEKLAADEVDIDFMYSVFGKTNGNAYMIMSAKDNTVMAESLKNNGIAVAASEELEIN